MSEEGHCETPVAPFYINGEWRYPDLSSDDVFEVRNPYTGDVVSRSRSATVDDVKEAVDAAHTAYLSWEKSDISLRQSIFLKAAEIFSSDAFKERCREAIESETAATIDWSLFNWSFSSNFLRACVSLSGQLSGEYMPSAAGGHVMIQRRAMGVILSISPWNAPLILSLRAVAIPIMCGNAVILKASEISPRSQALVVEAFHEAGLPKGVLNLITTSREMSPHITGSIIAHPKVRMINFTGSHRVGRLIAMEAAKYLKPCVVECGGKAPSVVLNDANIAHAANAIVFAAMMHSGQVCMSTERVIVQRAVADKLISAVVELARGFTAGDPAHHRLAPLFSKESADRVRGMIREAVDEGAEMLVGDPNHDYPECGDSVVQPHILLGVNRELALWKEETFAPVTVIAICDTVDEAVDLANDSEYSLSAAVWTDNVHQAFDVAARINSGFTNVNGATLHTEPTVHVFGLGGASGYGRLDVEHFTHKRRVVFHPPMSRYIVNV